MQRHGEDLVVAQVSGHAKSGCWAGEWEKETREPSPGTITIWGLVICFQSLEKQTSTGKVFHFEIFSPSGFKVPKLSI